MKKLLMVLGGLFGAFLLVVGLFVGYAFVNGPALDKESKEWTDAFVPQLTTAWDSNVLFTNGSAELLNVAPKEKMQQTFVVLESKLGKLKSYKGSKGEAGINFDLAKGKAITANYTADAEFEKGPVQIHLRLKKESDTWKVTNINFNSNLLISGK